MTTLAASWLLTAMFQTHPQADLWWPQFRGPNAGGIADGRPLPANFDPAKNADWKTALPGGHSSPCIAGDRIFITGFDGKGLETICLHRKTGSICWRKAAACKQIEKYHSTGSPAAPTPATHGRNVYVYFGSFGLIAYGLDGNEVWAKPMPIPLTDWGAATSPIVWGDRLFPD